jgi:hypothetical protein
MMTTTITITDVTPDQVAAIGLTLGGTAQVLRWSLVLCAISVGLWPAVIFLPR